MNCNSETAVSICYPSLQNSILEKAWQAKSSGKGEGPTTTQTIRFTRVGLKSYVFYQSPDYSTLTS